MFIVLSAALFFFRLGERDLWSSHEGRAAQDAQSILDEGCWGLPRQLDLHLELQKPPLYYWLVAGAERVLGQPVDAWLVRLPAAAAGLAGVLGVYLLAAACERRTAGLIAAGVLATAQHYTWLARIGRIDMPLTLAVGVAVGGFYLARRRGRAWLPVAYVAAAVAVLLKGPVGLALPVAAALAALAVEAELPPPWAGRRWLRLAGEVGLWWGVPLCLAIALPWYVWAAARTDGSLVRTFLWYHNVERAFGGGALRAHPWWFYAPRLAADFFPWSLLLPAAAWYFLRRRRTAWRADPEARFGLAWLVAMVALMSCLRFKRADYLLPAYPGAALFLGCAAERWYRAGPRRVLAGAFAAVLAACAVGWWYYVACVLPAEEPVREQRRFAAEIRRRLPAPGLVLFFRVESHALAFHVGSPIDTFLEWENLNVWAGRPGTHYLVMPPDCAAEWPRHISAGRLQEVLRNTDLPGAAGHDHPLVLVRTVPNP